MVVYLLALYVWILYYSTDLTNGMEEIVCGGLDIRNGPSHFLGTYEAESLKKYNVCTVIEGDVRLILMTNETLTLEDFYSLRFPKVREITGSLMVFQVVGLTSLEYLFPELRVIRGNTLVHNYALVLFQNPKLKEIGLTKLTEITRGGVRIVDNADLCYADTINWTAISRDVYTPPFIEHNQNPNICADNCLTNISVNSDAANCTMRLKEKKLVRACWNHHTCQPICPDECRSTNRACNYSIPEVCCHPECVGGCTGPGASDCYACRHVHHEGQCKNRCPDNYYKIFDRRCVTKAECDNRRPIQEESGESIFYKALNFKRTCELKCPVGYEEHSVNKKQCVVCPDSGCTQKCQGVMIQSLSDAAAIKGCNIMNGALDITMHSGLSGNVIEKLEEYLGSLREVRDYVKISFTPSLVSLSMLKTLRVIKGDKLWNEKYALSVFENVNLAQLWNFTNGKESLKIVRGTVQFQNNPQLCPKTTIKSMIDSVQFVDKSIDYDQHDVSFVSNGNKAVCEELEIFLKLVYVTSDSVVVNWEEFNTTMMDHRMFLGYQIYYRVVDSENVNIYENRDACSDSWQMLFYDTEERGALLTGLKPFTLYAFYVKTLMVNSPGAKGGISKVTFLRTKFDYPSPVLLKKMDSRTPDSIYMEWEMPLFPNGEITHYMITYSAKRDSLPTERNYCEEPPNYSNSDDKPLGIAGGVNELGGLSPNEGSKPTNHWPSRFPPESSNTCSKYTCCDCTVTPGNGSTIAPDNDVVRERAAFENIIHNIVFVNNRRRKKRSITDENNFSGNNRYLSKTAQDKDRFTIGRQKRAIDSKLTSVGGAANKSNNHSTTGKIAENRKNRLLPLTDHNNFTGTDLSIGAVLLNFPMNGNVTTEIVDIGQQALFTEIRINVTGLNFTLTGLKHFTSYEIKISACQNLSIVENYCSRSDVIRMKRTLMTEFKDAVNESSIVVVNFTSDAKMDRRLIKWDPPVDPNGLIVAYELEYAREASTPKVTKKECVLISEYVKNKGIFLYDLHPGNYSLKVRALSLAQRGPWTSPMYFYIAEPHNLREILVVSLSVGCSIIAVILGVFVVVVLYRRNFNKKLPKYLTQFVSANPEYISQLEVYKADEWELKRDDIELLREIGRGTFGTVYAGRGKNVVSICGAKFGECAVKTVGEKATIYDRWHFLIEASLMKNYNTAYIVKLYGVVSEGQPALVVMELMHRGSLKEFLTSRRPTSEENIHGLSPPTLREVLQMAGEIADGMAYLEALKFCHRDLAARNCMVAADGTCKIGDFGMARDVYIKDYYRPQGRRLMPVRWMAPEALKDATFTSKSDVWSYGVILWEIATLASQPYPGLTNQEVFSFVVDAHQCMTMPIGCPERLHDLMTMCWQYDAKLRPTFAELVESLLPDLNESFFKSSYFCSQRGGDQPLRSTLINAAIAKLSPTAVNAGVTVDSTGGSDCSDPGAPLNRDRNDSVKYSKRHRGSSSGNDSEHTEPICNNNRRSGFLSRLRKNTLDSSSSNENNKKQANGTLSNGQPVFA